MQTDSIDSVLSSGVGDRLSGNKKYRVQLDVEANDFALINQLVEELEVGTRAELFRSGLRALRWMIRKKKEGSTIVAITSDQRIMEPEFDFLMHIHPLDVGTNPMSDSQSPNNSSGRDLPGPTGSRG